jgi:hypothetical protein
MLYSQVNTEAAVDHLNAALQHAQQAAAASAGHPALHAAAMLACGRAHMLQAHAALLKQQQQQQPGPTQQLGTLPSDSSRGSSSSSGQAVDGFDAAWLPWPGCVPYTSRSSNSTTSSGSMDGTVASHSTVGEIGSSSGSQAGLAGLDTTQGPLGEADQQAPRSDGGPASAEGTNTPAALSGTTPGSLSASGCAARAEAVDNSSAAAVTSEGPCQGQGDVAATRQLPAPAAQLHQQAEQYLHQALQEALQHQLLHIAERASRALVYCCGLLQPERAALYLAVAQSCSSTQEMRRGFEGAAARQHAEVLLWRQLQQLESCGPGSVHLDKVQDCCQLVELPCLRPWVFGRCQ